MHLSSDEFKKIGMIVVDELSKYLDEVNDNSITTNLNTNQLKGVLDDVKFTHEGENTLDVFLSGIELLKNYSFHGNHPRQWGYILPTVDPISSLAELVSGVFNQNLGGWEISPIATEIECQTIKWLAEIVGYDLNCGGAFVSGGNVANFTAILCAKTKKLRDQKINKLYKDMGNSIFTIYVSVDTHTWIEKLIDLFGFDRENLRLVNTDEFNRMDVGKLNQLILKDIEDKYVPLVMVATAGTTSTGAIDPILSMHEISKKYSVWLHVDGAYGSPAAFLDEASTDLKSLSVVDSVAIDPHKWMYSSYESGCVLIKDKLLMKETFTYVPKYYGDEESIDEGEVNFYQYGLQNSRSFKALKVWMQLRSLGKNAFKERIKQDINHAKYLFELINSNCKLESCSYNLSVVTFRYVNNSKQTEYDNTYLNDINKQLLVELNKSGYVYFSHTEIKGNYLLRACFVNLKTTINDIDKAIELLVATGDGLYIDQSISVNKVGKG